MTRIGLISDTHHWLDQAVGEYFKDCNEIWHAGDFGNIHVVNDLEAILRQNSPNATNDNKIKAVYGNIDGHDIRKQFPEQLVFMCEGVKVMMRHIGGYPPKYNPETRQQIIYHKPKLFISGHSHILKIMYDDKLNCLHMNPGAAGKHGWHKMRTLIRFTIDGAEMKDAEVVELGIR